MDRKLLSVVALAGLALAGCASQSGSAYQRAEARREMSVRLGVVESVRQVLLEGTESGVGGFAGTAVGGIAGSNVGHGRGSAVGTILGAVAGGVAGNAIEHGATKKAGVEITVKLENGSLVAITQEADEAFHAGERVRILSDGRTSRVSH